MTVAVQRLLSSFDQLSEAEKQEAAVELLRRVVATSPPDVPDQGLVDAAESLFLDLDAREARDGHA